MTYYDPKDLQRIPDLVGLAPEPASRFFAFEEEVYSGTSALPLKTKELIAVAAAHLTGCPYCIDVHVRKYQALGGTMEEIMEALLVTASTRAGAVLSHGVHALKAFEAASQAAAEAAGASSAGDAAPTAGAAVQPHPTAGAHSTGKTPDCFC